MHSTQAARASRIIINAGHFNYQPVATRDTLVARQIRFVELYHNSMLQLNCSDYTLD
jgi:3-dehydroquinate dehydratase